MTSISTTTRKSKAKARRTVKDEHYRESNGTYRMDILDGRRKKEK